MSDASKIASTIDAQIRRRISQIDFADTAQVVKVDSTRYQVDINVHGNGETLVITGVPVLSQYAGPSQGIVLMPNVGDAVVVIYLGPNKTGPMVIGSYYSNPLPTDDNFAAFHTTEGDFLLKHKSGAFIKIDSVGNIVLNAASGKTINHTRGGTP